MVSESRSGIPTPKYVMGEIVGRSKDLLHLSTLFVFECHELLDEFEVLY